LTRFTRAAGVLALAALLLSLPARGQDGPRIKNLTGRVSALAMDGTRVAYAVATSDPACATRVFTWTPADDAGAVVSGAATCRAQVREVAVAANRVAWIAGRGRVDELFTAAVPRPAEKRLALAMRSGGRGAWLGRLVGDGVLLAFNLWSTDTARRITSGALRRVMVHDLGTIKEGVGTLFVRAVDANRIVVAHDDGMLVMYARDGRLMRSIAAPGASLVALQGRDLVTLAGTQLTVYDALTGALVHTWPVPATPPAIDVQLGVVAYAFGGDVHALQLATGKDVVLAQLPGVVRDVELEADGLVFAYDSGGSDNLGYLTPAQVAAPFAAA
jgi:hypothetical protein